MSLFPPPCHATLKERHEEFWWTWTCYKPSGHEGDHGGSFQVNHGTFWDPNFATKGAVWPHGLTERDVRKSPGKDSSR